MGLSLLRPQQTDLVVSLCFKLLVHLLLNGPIVPKSCKMHVLFPYGFIYLFIFAAPKMKLHHCPSITSSAHSPQHINGFLMLCMTFSCMNLLLFSAVMEYQVQINNVKAKLQETCARKEHQEQLIMKVENQALKVSSTCTFSLTIRIWQSCVYMFTNHIVKWWWWWGVIMYFPGT